MARTTKGRLYVRGKKEMYYLQYYVNGQQFRVALKDEDGNGITVEKKAKIAAARILLPLTAKADVDRLRMVANELQTAEVKAEAAEMDMANRRATIADGWLLFMSCPKRPASCKRFPVDAIPRHTSAANYRGYYKRFAGWLKIHHPEARLLSDVTPDIAAEFMDELRVSAASGTYNQHLHFLTRLFNTLAGAGKIATQNPFRDVDRAARQYNSKKPLSVEQVAALIDSATGDMRMLTALGYFTGLRLGDCCTLQWREVDLLRGVIERIPRKTAHTVKDKAQAAVKIGIAPYLFEMLAAIPASERGVYLLPKLAETYLSGDDYQITQMILRHFRSCGIEVHRPGTGVQISPETGKKQKTGVRAVVEVGFHSLRYSYISHNAEAGTPAAIIQRNAGHSSPAMTEHYTRISDQAAVRYAAALRLPSEAGATAESASPDPERLRLHQLADTLPLEQIRSLLKDADIYNGEGSKKTSTR